MLELYPRIENETRRMYDVVLEGVCGTEDNDRNVCVCVCVCVCVYLLNCT